MQGTPALDDGEERLATSFQIVFDIFIRILTAILRNTIQGIQREIVEFCGVNGYEQRTTSEAKGMACSKPSPIGACQHTPDLNSGAHSLRVL
jgi:hypothetical protein